MQPRVLLVHGLLNASWWLLPLALRLRKQGFATELFDYSSVWEGPEFALPRLRKRLLAQPPDALVGHSLGGLIALTALQQAGPKCRSVANGCGGVARYCRGRCGGRYRTAWDGLPVCALQGAFGWHRGFGGNPAPVVG